MPVKLNSTGGGSVTLTTPSTGSDFTVTIPAATGTMVTTTSASTIEFAAGTVSAPSITTTGDTNTGIYFPAADTIAFTEGGVESMRIDSSGNVGIGTSSNNVFDQVAGSRPLLVQSGSSNTTVAGSTNAITVSNSDTTTNNSSQINFAAITGASTNQYSTAVISSIHGARTNGQYPSGTLVFSVAGGSNTAPTERARINSSGDLLLGQTSDSVSAKLSVTTSGNGFHAITTSGSGNVAGSFERNNAGILVNFRNNGSDISGATIYNNSGSSVSYNTGSDYRLKDDVQKLNSGLSKVAALNPVSFKWKLNGDTGEGFIAHELAEHIPLAVTGRKDAVDEDRNPVYQGVDYSKIVVHLVAAIQELKADNDAMKERIALLEAK